MFAISLFFSSVLAVTAILIVLYSRTVVLSYFIAFLSLAVAPICLMLSLHPVMLQGALLFVPVACCSHWAHRRRAIIPATIATTAIAYGFVSYSAWSDIAAARAQYPMESLENRLPIPVTVADLAIPKGLLDEITDLEDKVESARNLGFWSNGERRLHALKMLHDTTYQAFISRPGFGVTRMPDPLDSLPDQKSDRVGPIEQPVQPSPKSSSVELMQEADSLTPSQQPAGLFHSMHLGGFSDFINGNRFGYLKDRAHVAGFRSHRFREIPKAPEAYDVKTVELVGLVVHPTPVVYISDHLPRMEELAASPKRAPSAFESEGLKEFAEGGNLFVRETPTHTRVLGSIRALKQCTECHACERGRLLGAFSYTLAKANAP